MATSSKTPTKAKAPAKRGRPKLAPIKTRARNPRSKSGKWYEQTGRPVKLDRKLLKATQDYYDKKKTEREMPFVEELAIEVLDVDANTVTNWCNKAKDKTWLAKQTPERQAIFNQFLGAIKKLATMQLMQLKVRGITDKHNTVAIFLMKADHGMIETSRHELGGIGGAPIEVKPVEVLSTKGRKAGNGHQA